jgi:dipeptidyl aminopeptidase/acylaminoacyl peptidase
MQLYHGTADPTVPIAWAQETCNALKAAGVQIDCFYYPDERHTFRSRVTAQFEAAVVSFYKKYLSA